MTTKLAALQEKLAKFINFLQAPDGINLPLSSPYMKSVMMYQMDIKLFTSVLVQISMLLPPDLEISDDLLKKYLFGIDVSKIEREKLDKLKRYIKCFITILKEN